MRTRNRRSCSSCPTSSQILIRMMPPSDVLFDLRAQFEKALVLRVAGKSHQVFDADPVVPAAVEDDDLASGGKSFDVTLHERLGLLAIRRGRKRTTRKTRGLTRSVIALMVPPLPAASRPSKMMMTRRPFCLTHSCR